MKKDEVPQDQTAYYAGARKAIYALDEQGAFSTVASTGWQAEETVTTDAANRYRELAAQALARARENLTSPLEFHMYDRRMDLAMLAETSGVWGWRIKRHFRPEVFARLGDKLMQRYANALGITATQMRQLP